MSDEQNSRALRCGVRHINSTPREETEEKYYRTAGGRRLGIHAGQYGARRGTDHLLGGMGSGQLSSGTGQRLHEGDRGQGHGGDHAVDRLPDQGVPRIRGEGHAYDMVVGNSQWLGAGSTQGHYVDLTDFFKKHNLENAIPAGYRRRLCRVSDRQPQILGDSARGRRHRLGLSQGLVRGPQGKGGVQGQVRLRPRRAEGLQADARHRRVLLSARSEALRHRDLHRQFL